MYLKSLKNFKVRFQSLSIIHAKCFLNDFNFPKITPKLFSIIDKIFTHFGLIKLPIGYAVNTALKILLSFIVVL